MRRALSLVLALVCVTVGSIASAQVDSLTTKRSAHNLQGTVERLESAITRRGATIIAKVDHAGAAKANGLELRATVVLIFGNPKLGTPLMQSNQLAGLDLPLRVLVWQDIAGNVNVGYWVPETLAQRYAIADRAMVIKAMTDAMGAITDEAVKP